MVALGVSGASAEQTVRVYVSMGWPPTLDNPSRHVRVVRPGATLVPDLRVYVVADSPGLTLQSIGYFGGIDRGIAFGHAFSGTNVGAVAALSGVAVEPLVPGAMQWVEPEGAIQEAFDGPEVQYLEGGGEPAAVPLVAHLLFRVDVTLANAAPCDAFDFYLFDVVAAWRGGDGSSGAFTTSAWLDTGGDSVPDGTLTNWGFDADVPVPVPPGSFQVDYIDGAPTGGPARIVVSYEGDLDLDGAVGLTDLATLLTYLGSGCGCFGCGPEDADGDGDVDLTDLAILLSNFGLRCG